MQIVGYINTNKDHLHGQKWNTQIEISAIKKNNNKCGNGLFKRSNYSLYYSVSNKAGQVGIWFIVTKKTLKYILGFEPYNERTCKLRIKGKYSDITLINVYAPTEGKMVSFSRWTLLHGISK